MLNEENHFEHLMMAESKPALNYELEARTPQETPKELVTVSSEGS